MKSRKLVVCGSIIALILVALAAGYAYGTFRMSKVFEDTLIETANGATGSKASVDQISLNLLAGSGTIKNLIIKPSAYGKPVFKVENVDIEFSPFSLLKGPLHIETVTVGTYEFNVAVGGRYNTATALTTSALAFVKSPSPDLAAMTMIVDRITFGKGNVAAEISVFRAKKTKKMILPSITKTVILPSIKMAGLNGGGKGIGPAKLAYKIIQQITARTIKQVTE